MYRYKVSRVPTNKNLVIKTDIGNVVLPPLLVDLDIYNRKGEEQFLSVSKLINVPYRLTAYLSDYKEDELNIYVDSNAPIKRKIQEVHQREDKTVIEYDDLYISMSTKMYNKFYVHTKYLALPNLEIILDRTYNSKLVVILKED